MIIKTDSVPGSAFIELLGFIHGDENNFTAPNPQGGKEQMMKIVQVKAVTPKSKPYGTWYDLVLDLNDWTPNPDGSGKGRFRADPKYITKVYEILGRKAPGSA